MGGQSFRKTERLLRRSQFETVMNKGRKKRVDNLCTVFVLPNGREQHRLGIIASRKVGNAVVRNRAKRRIREIFRRHKQWKGPALDIVIISGKHLVTLPFELIEKKIVGALRSFRNA